MSTTCVLIDMCVFVAVLWHEASISVHRATSYDEVRSLVLHTRVCQAVSWKRLALIWCVRNAKSLWISGTRSRISCTVSRISWRCWIWLWAINLSWTTMTSVWRVKYWRRCLTSHLLSTETVSTRSVSPRTVSLLKKTFGLKFQISVTNCKISSFCISQMQYLCWNLLHSTGRRGSLSAPGQPSTWSASHEDNAQRQSGGTATVGVWLLANGLVPNGMSLSIYYEGNVWYERKTFSSV